MTNIFLAVCGGPAPEMQRFRSRKGREADRCRCGKPIGVSAEAAIRSRWKQRATLLAWISAVSPNRSLAMKPYASEFLVRSNPPVKASLGSRRSPNGGREGQRNIRHSHCRRYPVRIEYLCACPHQGIKAKVNLLPPSKKVVDGDGGGADWLNWSSGRTAWPQAAWAGRRDTPLPGWFRNLTTLEAHTSRMRRVNPKSSLTFPQIFGVIVVCVIGLYSLGQFDPVPDRAP